MNALQKDTTKQRVLTAFEDKLLNREMSDKLRAIPLQTNASFKMHRDEYG